MAFKMGANKIDQNQIAKLYAAGKSAEEISKTLLIDVKIVEAFKPKADKK